MPATYACTRDGVNGVAAAGAGLGIAILATCVAVPASIAVVHRTDFLDRPREYHGHGFATPLLGGTAVLFAVLLSCAALGAISGRWAVALGCAVALCALGTRDDRIAVAPKWRLLAEAGVGAALFAVGLRFRIGAGGGLDLVATIVWVVVVVNAFNLMDNLDGACATVALTCALGLGTLAALQHDRDATVIAFALAGATAAFLRWNLARPSRQFLGDGGSMPIGMLIAVLGLAVTGHRGASGPLGACMLAGLPLLDTALVSVSRHRRGVPLVTGGRDHLSHRLLGALGAPKRVALTLCLVQAGLSAVAVICDRVGAGAVIVSSAIVLLGGLAAIAMLDTTRWRRPLIATAVTVPPPATRVATAVTVPAPPALRALQVAAVAAHAEADQG
jgi:UDP-GlcNAc:undecaprenyl-phosphate/decaprenyl-phosphate GlcNAc-1-phosphate transferase